MTLTIETNKRSFINAIVALCKSAGIVSYKVENTKPNTQVAVPVADWRDAYKDAENDENEEAIIAHFKKNIGKISNPQTSMTMDELYKALADD
jgi:hypothetical protein